MKPTPYNSTWLTGHPSGVPILFFSFFFALLGLSPALSAQGDLLITPRRIVFEGNKQRQEITLANTGQDTARYVVSFVNYRMKEDGSFEQITEADAGQMFAEPYLRYFPHSVVLAPKESQTIRMQVRRPTGMKTGEYRSHMYFRAVPQEKPLGEAAVQVDTTMIGIRLTPIFGITIPVIIREGNLSANITLSDISLKKEPDSSPYVSLTFNRQGNRSIYGDLTVNYVPPQGQEVEVGIVRGIAVYTPNTMRRFTLQLNQAEGIDFRKGKLVLRYGSPSEAKKEIFAESEFILQ